MSLKVERQLRMRVFIYFTSLLWLSSPEERYITNEIFWTVRDDTQASLGAELLTAEKF